ncbi:MAG TPA: M50 family metallopeptidase [Rubrobacteraceae bacterium]|nr:M50 family metallopeptidase [Rubrobacteraceae bacterium]
MTILVAIVGLVFLIVIHELGHMLTAKALGVRVPEFGIGFGPAIIKKKLGNTVYSFRIILLGGFARMAGMEGMASVGRERGELAPDTFPAKSAWRRALIIFAGPFANLVAAVAILAGVLMISGAVTDVRPEVSEIEPGSMADRVGIQAGDRLVGIDGERIEAWEGFTREVSSREPGEEISVTVERGGSERTFSGELGADPENEERPLVGVRPEVERTRYGPVEATWRAVEQVAFVTVRLGAFVGQLVTGEQSFYDNVTGPVGIATVGSTSVEQGFFPQLLALISLNLALFNLLPVLPLDGGHLLLIAAEKVLRRPVSPETIGKVTAVGLVLVLALFLFATYADLSKIITGQPFIPE